jgi:hypothetical protein
VEQKLLPHLWSKTFFHFRDRIIGLRPNAELMWIADGRNGKKFQAESSFGQKKVFPPLGGEFSNRGKNATREASSGLKIPTWVGDFVAVRFMWILNWKLCQSPHTFSIIHHPERDFSFFAATSGHGEAFECGAIFVSFQPFARSFPQFPRPYMWRAAQRKKGEN